MRFNLSLRLSTPLFDLVQNFRHGLPGIVLDCLKVSIHAGIPTNGHFALKSVG